MSAKPRKAYQYHPQCVNVCGKTRKTIVELVIDREDLSRSVRSFDKVYIHLFKVVRDTNSLLA
jgi:hypothetical protein